MKRHPDPEYAMQERGDWFISAVLWLISQFYRRGQRFNGYPLTKAGASTSDTKSHPCSALPGQPPKPSPAAPGNFQITPCSARTTTR